MSAKNESCFTNYTKHWYKKNKKLKEKREERKDQLRRKHIKRLRRKAKEKKKIDRQENQMILETEQVLALKKLREQDEKSKKQ